MIAERHGGKLAKAAQRQGSGLREFQLQKLNQHQNLTSSDDMRKQVEAPPSSHTGTTSWRAQSSPSCHQSTQRIKPSASTHSR